MVANSQIIINDQGVTIKTNGKIVFRATQHQFTQGYPVNVKLPILPDSIKEPIQDPHILHYLVKNTENEVLSNKPYILIDQDGHIEKGVTDQQGFMNLKTTDSAQPVTTRVMVNEIEAADDKESGEDL